MKINNLKIHEANLYRIDETHTNPRKAWEEMGSPVYPDRYSLKVLKEASIMNQEAVHYEVKDEGVEITFTLPKDSVVMIRIA